jgi:hypothetical protein
MLARCSSPHTYQLFMGSFVQVNLAFVGVVPLYALIVRASLLSRSDLTVY